jgi:hypothetical protein
VDESGFGFWEGLSGSVLVGCEQICYTSAPILICPYLEIEELPKYGFFPPARVENLANEGRSGD